MILSELVKLYDRVATDQEFSSRLPRMGMSTQNVAYYVVLTPEGTLFDIQDARVAETLPPKKKGGTSIQKMVEIRHKSQDSPSEMQEPCAFSFISSP